MPVTTPKWLIPTPLGTGDAPDVPLWMLTMALSIDDMAKDITPTTLGARPAAAKSGRWHRATDVGTLARDTGVAWEEIVGAGDLKATARASAPSGWLLCDGAAISRTTYAILFAAIGTGYGVGNGTTTFNIPDLRGRVPVGVDGTAARLTAADALGNSGGEEKHLLSVSELANHIHPVSTTSLQTVASGSGASVANGTPGNTGAGGGDNPHNNMQPYQIVNWLIKT